VRRNKKKHDDHGVPHVDEKWLVSYSDMMTLLFGLFVMLYSFAMKNKSVADAVEKELRKVSEKGFQTTEIDQNTESMQKMIETSDTNELKRIIASLNSDMNKMRSQLAQAKDELSTKDMAMVKMAQTSKVSQVKVQEAVSKAVAGMKSVPADANSVIVFVRWANKSHDVDLTVTTPTGEELNFKNRKIASNDPDEFVNDSDRGPGVEMFKTTAPKDGEYSFNVSLYNSRGDESPNEVELFMVINGQEKLIEKIMLKDDDKNRQKTTKINLKKFE
jgi:hypothetical protein